MRTKYQIYLDAKAKQQEAQRALWMAEEKRVPEAEMKRLTEALDKLERLKEQAFKDYMEDERSFQE